MNPHAVRQNWLVATSIGYHQGLGGGQALGWREYAGCPEVAVVQHYPRALLASLQHLSPDDLCWKREGVSVKGFGAPAAAQHNARGFRYLCREAKVRCKRSEA